MMKQNKAREFLISEMLETLKEDRFIWRKPYVINPPYNGMTDRTYSGVNRFILQIIASKRVYKDPRWLTFKQIEKEGYTLKKGSKGVPIEFWSYWDKKNKKRYSIIQAAEKQKEDPEHFEKYVTLVARTYYVFNADNIIGIPELPKEPLKQSLAKNVLEQYLKEENIEIIPPLETPAYVPSEDKIMFPTVDSFKNEYKYYSTLSHEIAHSTGHETRLNREFSFKQDSNYAKEELRAEIASCFICSNLGLKVTGGDMESHKGYVQSWLQLIEEKPNELFKAIKEADKINEFVLEKGDYEYYYSLEQENELEQEDEFVKTLTLEDQGVLG